MARLNILITGATKLLARRFGTSGVPVERGSRTLVHLALAPEAEGVTGAYYVECRPARPADLALEPELRSRFWEHTGQLLKGR